jgi:putative Mg2+ transporter-C (MgtC) family protein
VDASFFAQLDSWYFRLILSLVLGSILGFERFFEEKPAGLRTITLVCTGSAAFMILAERLQGSTAFAVDPTRVAQGVITGIGFLGAGTILQRREGVRGLTTAATVWMTAAVGMACGSGAFDLALLGTLLGIVILQGYGLLERWFRRRGLRSTRPEPPATVTGAVEGAPRARSPRRSRRRRRRSDGDSPRVPE